MFSIIRFNPIVNICRNSRALAAVGESRYTGYGLLEVRAGLIVVKLVE